jgi:hypothetical protein
MRRFDFRLLKKAVTLCIGDSTEFGNRVGSGWVQGNFQTVFPG